MKNYIFTEIIDQNFISLTKAWANLLSLDRAILPGFECETENWQHEMWTDPDDVPRSEL